MEAEVTWKCEMMEHFKYIIIGSSE